MRTCIYRKGAGERQSHARFITIDLDSSIFFFFNQTPTVSFRMMLKQNTNLGFLRSQMCNYRGTLQFLWQHDNIVIFIPLTFFQQE